MTIYADSSLVLALYILLAAYGIGYGALIEFADRKGYTEGFAWLAAALWALVTVGAMAAICWQMALIVAGAFTCSGLPIAGRMIWRYMQRREREQKCLRANILSDDCEDDDVR